MINFRINYIYLLEQVLFKQRDGIRENFEYT